MKHRGCYFEIKRNYFKQLAYGRICGVLKAEQASSNTGNPIINTPYSDMPISLRVSTFASEIQSSPIQETDFLGEAHLAHTQIRPINGSETAGLSHPEKISARFIGLYQMIRDKIIDPMDEVLVKIHDALNNIPEILYNAELKLREIFPLVIKAVIPTALMLLVFINKAYGADGTGDDVSVANHIFSSLSDVGDFITNHYKIIGLIGLNIWAFAAMKMSKTPDDLLGGFGKFFIGFGKHIIFPLAMILNLVFLGKGLATTEYMNIREIVENIGFVKLIWPSLIILGSFIGKTVFDYFKTRPNLDLDPHGTRLNHILTHFVYNFAIGAKVNYLAYRIIMTLLGAGFLLLSLGVFGAALIGGGAIAAAGGVFILSALNLFFGLWLLKSDIHMGIHALIFMRQQKASLVGERNPIISDRFKRMISGAFGPNTMIQKPHFNPNEAAFAGFYTMIINDYSQYFELELETDLQPYSGQGAVTGVVAGFEMAGWIEDTQQCIQDIARVPYDRYCRDINQIKKDEEEGRLTAQDADNRRIAAHHALIDELIRVNDTLADLYGDEGVDIAQLRLSQRLHSNPDEAEDLQDRLFAQRRGKITLFGLLADHIERDIKRKKDGKPAWFHDGDRITDRRFQNAVRKRLYRQSIEYRRRADLLRERLRKATQQGNIDTRITRKEVEWSFEEIISRYGKTVNYVVRKEDNNDDKKAAKITNVAFCQTHAGDTLCKIYIYDKKKKRFYVEYIPSLFIRMPNPRYKWGIPEADGHVEPRYLWVDRTQLRDYLKFSHSGSNEIEFIDNSPPQDARSRDIYVRVGWRKRKIRAYDLGEAETPNPGSTLVLRKGKEHSLDGCQVWVAGNTDSNGLEDMIVVNEEQKEKFDVPEGKISWFRKRPEVISFITPYSYLMNDSEHVDISTPTTSGAFLEKDSRVNKVLRMMFAYNRKRLHFDDPEPDRDVSEIRDITWTKSDLAFVFYEEVGTVEDIRSCSLTARKGDVILDDEGKITPYDKFEVGVKNGRVYRLREVPYDVMREGFRTIQAVPGKKLPLDSKKVHRLETRIDSTTGKYYLMLYFKGKIEPVRIDMLGQEYARFLPHPDKILRLGRNAQDGGTVEFLGFTERIGVTSYMCVDYGEGYKNAADRYRFVRMPGRLQEFSSERITRIWKPKGSNQIFLNSSVQRPGTLPWDDDWACAGSEDDPRLRVVGFDRSGKVYWGYDPVERVYKWAPTKKEAELMGLVPRTIKDAKGKNLIKVRYKVRSRDAEGRLKEEEKETVMPVGSRLCGRISGSPQEVARIDADLGNGTLQSVSIDRQFLFELAEGEVLPEEVRENFGFIRHITLREENYGYDQQNNRLTEAQANQQGVTLRDVRRGITVVVNFFKEGNTWTREVDGNTFRGFSDITFPALDRIYQDPMAAEKSLRTELDDEGNPTRNNVINEDFEFTRHPQLFAYEGRIYIRFHTCKKTRQADMPDELRTLYETPGVKVIDIHYNIAESAVKVEEVRTGRIEWVPSVAHIDDVDIKHVPDTKVVKIGYYDHSDTYREGGDLLYDYNGQTYRVDLDAAGIPVSARNLRIEDDNIVFESFEPDEKGKLVRKKIEIAKLGLPDGRENLRVRNQFTDARKRKYVRTEIPKDARNVRIERGSLMYETGSGTLTYVINGQAQMLDLSYHGLPSNASNLQLSEGRSLITYEVLQKDGSLQSGSILIPSLHLPQDAEVMAVNDYRAEVVTPLTELGISQNAFVYRTFLKELSHGYIPWEADAKSIRLENGHVVFEVDGRAESIPLSSYGINDDGSVGDEFFKRAIRRQVQKDIGLEVPFKIAIQIDTATGKLSYSLIFDEKYVAQGYDEITTDSGERRFKNGKKVPKYLREITRGDGSVTYHCESSLEEDWKLNRDGTVSPHFIVDNFKLREGRGKRRIAVSVPVPIDAYDFHIRDGVIRYRDGRGELCEIGDAVSGSDFIPWEHEEHPQQRIITFNVPGSDERREIDITEHIPVNSSYVSLAGDRVCYLLPGLTVLLDVELSKFGVPQNATNINLERVYKRAVYQMKITQQHESDIMHGYYASTTGPQNTIGGDEQSNFDQRPFYTHDPSSGEAELEFFPFNEYYLDTPGGIIQIGKSSGHDKHGKPTSVTVNNGTPFFMKWSAVLEAGEVELPLLEFPYKRKLVLFGTEMGEASTIEDFQQTHYTLIEWRRQNKFIPKPSSLAENQGGAGVVAKMATQRQRWGGSKEIGVDYILPDVLEEIFKGKILGTLHPVLYPVISRIPWVKSWKTWETLRGQPSVMTWKEIIDHLMLITWYFVGPGELGRQLSPAVFLLSNGEIKPYIADFEYFTATVALDVLGGMGGFAFSMFKGGYRPFYSVVKGPGRFAALVPAYYELFDNRYQGSAIGPFNVTATTFEGTKRSHRRLLGLTRGLNKLAIAYALYKFIRYETNLVSHLASDEQTRALLLDEGLADPGTGGFHPDYFDRLHLHSAPLGQGGQVLLPEDLGPAGDVIAPPAGYEELTRHGAQIITPPSSVSRVSQEGVQVLGDDSGFLTFSTYGNVFWAAYLLFVTHFGVKWLRTVMGVPKNTFRPYEEEMEVKTIQPAAPTPPNGGNPGGNPVQPGQNQRRQISNNDCQLEEILRAKETANQAIEDTPSMSDGFADTRVVYGNTASATDWQLIVEASKLLSSDDIHKRILGRAILRKVERESYDLNARHDARKMLHQSKKVYPEIRGSSTLIGEARQMAHGLGESDNFMVDLLYLEGFRDELHKPMAIWHNLCKRNRHLNDFTYQEAERLKIAAVSVANAMSEGISRKIDVVVRKKMGDIDKLRCLRDLMYRIRYARSIGRFILRKLPRQRRLIERAYGEAIGTLREEMNRVISSLRANMATVEPEDKLRALIEIYKAQSAFNFKGIRLLREMFYKLRAVVPFVDTPSKRRKVKILKEINAVLQSGLRQKLQESKKALEEKKGKTGLSQDEKKELERINELLKFDYYDELMALQKDYINFLKSFVIATRRKSHEKAQHKAAGIKVRESADREVRDIFNSFKSLVAKYDSFKSAAYKYYLRSSDFFADIGMKFRWTIQNYANYALELIQAKREKPEDVLGRIRNKLSALNFNDEVDSLDKELSVLTDKSSSDAKKQKSLEAAVFLSPVKITYNIQGASESIQVYITHHIPKGAKNIRLQGRTVVYELPDGTTGQIPVEDIGIPEGAANLSLEVYKQLSEVIEDLLKRGKFDDAYSILCDLAKINHPNIAKMIGDILKAKRKRKKEIEDKIEKKTSTQQEEEELEKINSFLDDVEKELESNPFNAELSILRDSINGLVSVGAIKRQRIARFVVSKKYAMEVINNPHGRYTLEERRQLLQEMLKTYFPFGRRSLQRLIARALVGIYNQKIDYEVEGKRKRRGNLEARKRTSQLSQAEQRELDALNKALEGSKIDYSAILGKDLKKEMGNEGFEGIFYEYYVLTHFYVRDEEKLLFLSRNNTNAYRLIWDLAPFRKEKYIRRHGRTIKKALNTAVLDPMSRLFGYRYDFRFSPVESVIASPDKLHDRVNRVSNSMSPTERRMFTACQKAGDEVLHDLRYRTLDFSIR